MHWLCHRATRFFLPLLLATVTACGADDGNLANEDKQDQNDSQQEEQKDDLLLRDRDYRTKPVRVPLDGSFDMCFSNPDDRTPEAGFGVDLNTAKWMAFFSSNVYAHHAHFAPVLEEMGFGEIGEGQHWVSVARDVILAKDHEAKGYLDEGEAAKFARNEVQQIVPQKKLQFLAGGQFIGKKVFEREITQLVWAEHRTEPVVVISFRGTDDLADMLLNKKFGKEPLDLDDEDKGRVHRGFRAAYEHVRPLLLEKLAAEKGRNLKVWITGHSLGGALATLAAESLLSYIDNTPDSGYELMGVYTFGKPRLGDETFVNYVEQAFNEHNVSVMRFRHADDVVTQLPHGWVGYHHSGQLIHLTASDGLDYNPNEQDPGGTESAEGFLDDHGMHDQYYPKIVEHVTSGNYPNLSAEHCSH